MSSYTLQGSIKIDLLIGEQDIKAGLNFFNDIFIVESVHQLVPTLTLNIGDSDSQLLKEFHLTDGMPVDILIAQDDQSSSPKSLRRYRMFGGNASRKESAGHHVSYNCVLDCPRYLGQAARRACDGNSSDALALISNDCGLTAKIAATNDRQIWLSSGQTYGQWAKKICDHGYLHETSCFSVAVSEKKELHYVDIINRLVSTAPKKILYHTLPEPTDGEGLIIYDVKAQNQSGLLNNWTNYGFQAQANGVNSSYLFSTSQVLKREEALAQSQAVRDIVNPSRLEHYEFDCGNVNDKYYRAYYQNFKLRASFTETLSVIILDYSNLSIYDVVEVRIGYGNYQDLSLTADSGFYLVAAKTRIVRNGLNYGERLELVRNSIRNVSPYNPLVS